MSKFKKPTKKEIKRMAELLVKYYSNDPNRERENELYLALDARLHKRACVEVVLSKFFGLDPF
jgi:hypothetical protein